MKLGRLWCLVTRKSCGVAYDPATDSRVQELRAYAEKFERDRDTIRTRRGDFPLVGMVRNPNRLPSRQTPEERE